MGMTWECCVGYFSFTQVLYATTWLAQEMVNVKMGSAYVTDCIQEISVRIKVCTLVHMCAKHQGFWLIMFILLINFILSDECENESDCSNHGACIDIQATSFPRRQCFCDPGWFGERCSRGKFIYAKQSVICLWNFSLSCYYVSMPLCVYCTETVIKKQRHKF